LAITVIGGLFTSTLLTLVVVPVIYQLTGKRRKIKEDTF
jgi:Cu/Ag efflux pump CusA